MVGAADAQPQAMLLLLPIDLLLPSIVHRRRNTWVGIIIHCSMLLALWSRLAVEPTCSLGCIGENLSDWLAERSPVADSPVYRSGFSLFES